MNRRNFLKLSAIGAALGYRPIRALAYNPLKFPLVSIPDEVTTLDEAKAAKARKLAEYVITKDEKRPGLISHNPNATNGRRDYQSVEAVIVVDGQRHSIYVDNWNKQDPNQKRKNGIVIYERHEGTTKDEDILSFIRDEGLDGRCNYGTLSSKASGTGKVIEFRDGFDGLPSNGLEHRDRFQALYDQTLDRLITFYEKPIQSKPQG